MRALVFVALGHLVGISIALCQPEPQLAGTLVSGGFYSRNMEVIDVLSVPLGGHDVDNFDVHSVPYMDGSTQKWKQLILATGREIDPENDVSHIAIMDVTDPYNTDQEYLRIRLRQPEVTVNNNPVPGPLVPINQLAVYRDTRTPESGTYKGEVFLIAHVGEDNNQLRVTNNNNPTARFIIINLSRTVALRQSGTANDIVIHDGKTRDVTYGGTVTGNQNIYVGYIPTVDVNFDMNVPHSVNYDQESGIMALANLTPTLYSGTLYSFVDIINMKDIAINCAANSSTLGIVNNLTMSGGLPVYVPLLDHPYTTSVTETASAKPHEVSPIRLSDTKVRLVISSSAHDTDWATLAGGVITMDVDYSSPTMCTTPYHHYWPYDSDRETPHKRYSDINAGGTNEWRARVVH